MRFTAEGGTSGNAGVGAVVGCNDRDFEAMWIYTPTGQLIAYFGEKGLE